MRVVWCTRGLAPFFFAQAVADGSASVSSERLESRTTIVQYLTKLVETLLLRLSFGPEISAQNFRLANYD